MRHCSHDDFEVGAPDINSVLFTIATGREVRSLWACTGFQELVYYSAGGKKDTGDTFYIDG